MLDKLEVNVHIKSSCVEVFVETTQEDPDRMAKVMVEVVSEVRSTQQSLVRTTEAKGYMKGQCFKCNEEMMITEDLDKMESLYSQFCCRSCRKQLGF